MNVPSVVVAATSFAATSPYVQSEWLLDSAGRPLRDGISFALSASSAENALAPRWAVAESALGADARGGAGPGAGTASYVSTQTAVSYAFAAYRVVVFVDLDDSMLSMLPDGSISFDLVAEQLSTLLDDLRTKTVERGVGVQLSLCAQHVDTGSVRTLFEGMLTTFAKAISPTQIRKLFFRHLYQPSAGPQERRRLAEVTCLEFALQYCVSHLQLMSPAACPTIVYVTSGLRAADVRASSRVLAPLRISLHVLLVDSLSCRIPDMACLQAVAHGSGGGAVCRLGAADTDMGVFAEQVLRPLYYRPLPSEIRREAEPDSLQLCSYELEGLMFQHIVALRLLDGFHLLAAFSEAGRYLDSASSERRLAYKYTFRFGLKTSKLTMLVYEASCLIFQKAVQSRVHRHRSARTSFRASRGHYTPAAVKMLSAPLPPEWSAAAAARRLELVSEIASEYQERDTKLAQSMQKMISLIDGSGSEVRLGGSGQLHHLKSVSDFKMMQQQQQQQQLASSSSKPSELRRAQSAVGEESPHPAEAASAASAQSSADIMARLLPLRPAIELVSSLDVLSCTHIYIRGLDLLTDLRQNSKFHFHAITNIMNCFGTECSYYELSNLRWLVVGPCKSNTGSSGSSRGSGREGSGGSSVCSASGGPLGHCPDMLLVSVTQRGGVFVQAAVSRFRAGPAHKLFFFKDDGLGSVAGAVSAALSMIGLLPEVTSRDLFPLYALTGRSGAARAIRGGKLVVRSTEYALDLSDPLVFSSVLNELSAAKLAVGFQINANSTDDKTGHVVMHFCAAVCVVLCDTPVTTLVQCRVVCRASGASIQYFCEQEFAQFQVQKNHNKLSSLVLLLSEQDENIMQLYSVVISIFSQYRDDIHGSAPSAEPHLAISGSQWSFLLSHSDAHDFLLPSFCVSDVQATNAALAGLLTRSLIENESFVPVSVAGAPASTPPSAAAAAAASADIVICKRIDSESFLLLELLTAPAAGLVDVSAYRGVRGDAEPFEEPFEACLTARFRLFKLPLLRSFVHLELASLAQCFGMLAEGVGVDYGAGGSAGGSTSNSACASAADLTALSEADTPTAALALPDPPRPLALPQRSRSGRVTKLFNHIKDSILYFHFCNYAVVLYAKFRNLGYVPTSGELATAMYNSRVVTHELDISTLCISKRAALDMSGRDLVLAATLEAFRATVGCVVTPVPRSEYFVYTPLAATAAQRPAMPIFIKFNYVLLSHGNGPAPPPGTAIDADAAAAAAAAAEALSRPDSDSDPAGSDGEASESADGSASAGAASAPLGGVYGAVLATLFRGCSYSLGGAGEAAPPAPPPCYASDEQLARCLVNLSEGLSPSGAALGDTSMDYLLRVQFFMPQHQSSLHQSSQLAASGGGGGGDSVGLDAAMLRKMVIRSGAPLLVPCPPPAPAAESAFRPGELSRFSYADYLLTTGVLAGELDTFIALDVLESLAVVDAPTPETLVLAQHCLHMIPGVLSRTVALDVVSPASLSSRNLPDVATNKILRFLDAEIQSCMGASKIGTLLVCLPACLFACLPVCLLACLPACVTYRSSIDAIHLRL
jgi:hypothetical protein